MAMASTYLFVTTANGVLRNCGIVLCMLQVLVMMVMIVIVIGPQM